MASVNGGVWGTVVAFERTGKKDGAEGDARPGKRTSSAKYVVDVLVNTSGDGPLLAAPSSSSSGGLPGGSGQRLALLPAQAKRLEPQVVSVPLAQVDCLSSVRVYIQKDLRPADARKNGIKCVAEAVARLTERSGRVPTLDPKDDMKVCGGLCGGLSFTEGALNSSPKQREGAHGVCHEQGSLFIRHSALVTYYDIHGHVFQHLHLALLIAVGVGPPRCRSRTRPWGSWWTRWRRWRACWPIIPWPWPPT